MSTRAEVAKVLALTSVVAALILVFAPPAGDAAAHLYRIYLVDNHIFVWDNFWYRGNYPILTYSVLYYPVAALVGNTALTVAGILVAAACFAVLALREWGRIAVWPARAFGVAAAGPLITGTFSYGLGLASGLGALLAAQRSRWWAVLPLAVVTVGLSPLAFGFLVLALAAVPIGRRHITRTTIAVGVGIALLVGLGSTAIAWLGSEGRYPFGSWSLFAVTTVAGCGVALAWRAPRARLLAVFFALWLAASVVLFFAPSPFGETVTRLRYVVFPLMLVTVLLAGWRPRWLAAVGLTVAALYNVVPYAVNMTARSLDSGPAQAEFWQPAIDFLRVHNTPDHLVEVVATESHWEAYWLPKAGIPIVRGWYRQTDTERNDLLYNSGTPPEQYRAWLDRNAVRFVVLPNARLDAYTGSRESALVRSPGAGLVPVLRTSTVVVYEVPRATRLLTGPGPARITELGHDQVVGQVGAPGRYELHLRWSPYWQVAPGDACIQSGPGKDSIDIVLPDPGPFQLVISDDIGEIVDAAFNKTRCG